MARPTNKLSVKFTEKADLKPGLYGDGGGLYLQVSDYKTKAWVFRYMMAGRARKMGLGDFELVTLKDARKKRDAAYGLVVDGVDPIDERKARKAAQRGRERQGPDVQGMRRGLHRGAQGKLEERQARRAMGGHPGDLRLSGHRQSACAVGRNRARHEDHPADLGNQDGDGEQGPRSHRKGFGSCQGPEASIWARIRRHGAGISTNYCRPNPRFRPSRTTRRCPMRSCRPSWRSFVPRRASTPAPWSSPS